MGISQQLDNVCVGGSRCGQLSQQTPGITLAMSCCVCVRVSVCVSECGVPVIVVVVVCRE